ncbi:MAG: RNA-binding protein [Parachlamydiaceae bacterium]|nr:RNA-binding protein [Parachlamydiaceae bacterium]
MKKKLFVGNLSWKATEDTLRPVFEAYGKVVSIKIITDHTGRSKGFGFVEMEGPEDAQNAINNLNEKPHLDRNMRVSLAQERTDRPAGGSYDRGNGGGGGGNDRGSDRGERRDFRGGAASGNRSYGSRNDNNGW